MTESTKKPVARASDKVKVCAVGISTAAFTEGDVCHAWGVMFLFDGEQLVAELPKKDADAMIEAGRVK